MMGIKLNAQVMIKNLQGMHEKSLPPTGARGRMFFCRSNFNDGTQTARGRIECEIRTGPACKAGDHTRADATTA